MWNPIRIAGLIALLGPGGFGGPVQAQQFRYVQSDGCAHVLLYGWNENRDEVIVVRADREELKLRVGTTRLNLSDAIKGLSVYLDIYARSLPKVDYCTDVRSFDDPRPTDTLHAYSGQVAVTLGKAGALKGRPPFVYEATVTLRDVSFKRPDGTVVTMKGPVGLKAVVGYVYG
jgi:hypothetical protein